METIEKTIEIFLSELKQFNGAKPTFKIDFQKSKIILKDAPSGFLNQLFKVENFVGHLTNEGLEVEFFRR